MPDRWLARVHPVRWLGQRDRGFAALRRATRAAIIMPAMFAVTGGVFVCLATLASQTVWIAAVAMAVVGFGVIFAGVVSSVL